MIIKASAAPLRGSRTAVLSRRIALVALAAWGLLHVIGGAALMWATATDGGRAALESMGSAASPDDIPLQPGPVAESVLQFHSLNILLAGIAVAAIVIIVARTSWPRGVTATLLIVAALDFGLIVFLVLPGYMKVSDALWGPLLFAIAAPAAWLAGWRPRQL